MKLIIAGSRGFTSYETLKAKLKQLGLEDKDLIVISGCARGADQLGEQWAHEFKKELIKMPADWNRFGKSAGYKRNEQMALAATHLVAFWDGQSPGTKHMIDLAEKYSLLTNVTITN